MFFVKWTMHMNYGRWTVWTMNCICFFPLNIMNKSSDDCPKSLIKFLYASALVECSSQTTPRALKQFPCNIFKQSNNSFFTQSPTIFFSGRVLTTYPPGMYLLKGNNRNTRTRCEICSKLTIKTTEWRQWRRFGVYIVNFEQI